MEMARRPGALLALLRLSLAPSVVADLAGGVALALAAPGGAPVVGRLAAVPLLLFCGGMALNGWIDRDADAVTRPKRPLPSGDVSAPFALTLAIVGLVTAPALAWWLAVDYQRDVTMVAIALAAAITLYHSPLKRNGLLGPLLLGAIRAGDLLLGAVAIVGWHAAVATAWPFALVYFGYVAGASLVAHEEDREPRMARARFGAALALTCVAIAGALGYARSSIAGDSRSAMLAVLVALWAAWSLRNVLLLFGTGAPGSVPLSSFARLLLSRLPLIPTTAAFAAGAGDLGILAIAAFWAVFVLVRIIPPT